MLWKHPTSIPRPQQQPKKRRHYYECDCGRKWSMVFETGDGKPRTGASAPLQETQHAGSYLQYSGIIRSRTKLVRSA